MRIDWKEGKLAMKLLKSSTVCVIALGLLGSVSGCSRDRIEAVNLSNEGDEAVKVNVEGAIQKYEQSIDLDPTSHETLWRLAKAYEKKEDWDKTASTLARAVQVAPDFANYWGARGHALVEQARMGNADAYKQAQEPLKKCIEKDPNIADCYDELGETYLWTDDEQSAADNFQKAIEHDASKGYFYTDLANLYITLKFYKEAQQVLTEGLKLVPPNEKNSGKIFNMYVLLSTVSLAQGDKAGQVAAMEKAEQFAGDAHPEFSYELGSTYGTMDPPQKEKALRLLNQFTKRVCKGAQATKFKDECEETSSLIQKLGS
jgi:tetratricopeptide (TPR) repeat protein